jgi:plasmid stabilization system protein ParE
MIWTAAAREVMRAIRAWLDERNHVAAANVLREIREAVSVLQSQAMLGRVGQFDGARELVIQGYPYLVIYEVVSGGFAFLPYSILRAPGGCFWVVPTKTPDHFFWEPNHEPAQPETFTFPGSLHRG